MGRSDEESLMAASGIIQWKSVFVRENVNLIKYKND